MPNIYEHLSDEDGTNIYLETFGVKEAEAKRSDLFGLVKCVVCGEENSETAKFCSRCGTVLDAEEAKKQMERQRVLDYLFERFKDLPEK